MMQIFFLVLPCDTERGEKHDSSFMGKMTGKKRKRYFSHSEVNEESMKQRNVVFTMNYIEVGK